jgi:hypothetical protein
VGKPRSRKEPDLVHKASNSSPVSEEESLEDVVRGSSLPHTKTAEGRHVFGPLSVDYSSGLISAECGLFRG